MPTYTLQDNRLLTGKKINPGANLSYADPPPSSTTPGGPLSVVRAGGAESEIATDGDG